MKNNHKTYKNIKSSIDKSQESRRTFIKKAVYVAPTLIVLGTLTRPTDAKADFGPPPSAPGPGQGW